MNLLFFLHSLSAGGAERVTATLANHWARKGYRVTVVTIAGFDRDFYALASNIQRIALGLDCPSATPIAALWNNARRVAALRQVLKYNKPDVAVSMMTTANTLLALAGQGLAVVTIGSERVHPPTVPLSLAWETLRRWSYPKLSAMVAQTEQSAAWLRRHAPSPRIAVIPNPVNHPMTSHEPNISPILVKDEMGAQRILLAVGRLTEQKGFDRLIKAFAKVVSCHPEWVLIILGEGSLRAELTEQAIDLGVADKVRLLGVVGNVGEWFDAADLFVLPSRFEGFPNTLLEALAHGLPGIAVDCATGPRDILRHEVDGLLVSQDDQVALNAAIMRLMDDDDLRQQFGRNSMETRERFSVDLIARQWEALMMELAIPLC